ncbi:MAG: hypothetical protein KH050_05330 [Clostridiaceae bacterium]|nr:hypothetical protein [Clostridiaceae bacterium]
MKRQKWFFLLCSAVLLCLTGCAQEQSSAASSVSASSAAEQTVVPEPTEITGKMAFPEEDIAAVDAWLKDWVQIQGKHAEGSTLNDNMTILESKIAHYGQSDVEANLYYQVRCAEDDKVYPVYEYVNLVKGENGWAPAKHEHAWILHIGGYDGENGATPITNYKEEFSVQFSEHPTFFKTPFTEK